MVAYILKILFFIFSLLFSQNNSSLILYDKSYKGSVTQNQLLFKDRPDLKGKSYKKRKQAWEDIYSFYRDESMFRSISLPRIPIHIDDSEDILLNSNKNKSYVLSSNENAFLRLTIEQEKSEFDNSFLTGLVCNYGCYLSGFMLGYLLTDSYYYEDYEGNIDTDEYNKARKYWGRLYGLTSLASFFFLSSQFNVNKNTDEYRKLYVDKIFNTKIYELDGNGKKIALLHDEKLNKGKLYEEHRISQKSIDIIIDKKYPNYALLKLKIDKYNREFSNDIVSNFKNNLKKLYKNKGEFETTYDYNMRLKREKIAEQNIISEYLQELSKKRAEHIKDKMILLRQIEDMFDEIRFGIDYKYNISKYDADSQFYTFKVPDLGLNKKLFVPIAEAPDFKNNIAPYLRVKKIKTAKMNGKWEFINKDVLLIDVRNNLVMNWEGQIPTIAKNLNTKPPDIKTNIKILDPSNDGFLDAGESVSLLIFLKNEGKGKSGLVQINLVQDSGPQLYFDPTKIINGIDAGKEESVKIKIKVPESTKSGKAFFKINFLEERGFEPQYVSFSVETRAQLEPNISLIDYIILDGKIERGKSAEITARIQNNGQGQARGVKVIIKPKKVDNIFLHPESKNNFNLGNLAPGAYKDITFKIITNNRAEDVVNIEMMIEEERLEFYKKDFLKIEIDKYKNELNTIAFEGKLTKRINNNIEHLSIDIEKDIPKGRKNSSDRLAVIFGIENYKKIPKATFANRDAEFINEYFQKSLSIKKERIYFKLDNDVGKAEFDKVFSDDGWLDKRIKKGNTELFIFFAGHASPGIKNKEAFLLPYDGDPNYASQTGYGVDIMFSKLNDLDAKSVTVFLDACFSGSTRDGGLLLSNARPVFIDIKPKNFNNITVFSASRGNEISSAWPEKKHGLFSYFLMKGFQGNADKNSDNNITIKELALYIEKNVSMTAGMLDREQHPTINTSNGNNIIVRF